MQRGLCLPVAALFFLSQTCEALYGYPPAGYGYPQSFPPSPHSRYYPGRAPPLGLPPAPPALSHRYYPRRYQPLGRLSPHFDKSSEVPYYVHKRSLRGNDTYRKPIKFEKYYSVKFDPHYSRPYYSDEGGSEKEEEGGQPVGTPRTKEIFPWSFYAQYQKKSSSMPMDLANIGHPILKFIESELIGDDQGHQQIYDRPNGFPRLTLFPIKDDTFKMPNETLPIEDCPEEPQLLFDDWEPHAKTTKALHAIEYQKWKEKLEIGPKFLVRMRHDLACLMLFDPKTYERRPTVLRLAYLQYLPVESDRTAPNIRNFSQMSPKPIMLEGTNPWTTTATRHPTDKETGNVFSYWKNLNDYFQSSDRKRKLTKSPTSKATAEFKHWCNEAELLAKKGNYFGQKEYLYKQICTQLPLQPEEFYPDEVFKIQCLGMLPEGTSVFTGTGKKRWQKMVCRQGSWATSTLTTKGEFTKCREDLGLSSDGP